MCKGIPPEDARFVLSIATQTKFDQTLKVFNVWLTGTFRVIKARSAFYLPANYTLFQENVMLDGELANSRRCILII